jgi:hypothetical protein
LNQFKPNTIKPEKGNVSAANEQADEMLKKASDFSFFIDKDNLSKLLPPLFMAVGIIAVYIALSHFHVKSLKEKEVLKSELIELRSEYISVKSSLMKQSNQSSVAKRLGIEGIKELRTPPLIIEKDIKK